MLSDDLFRKSLDRVLETTPSYRKHPAVQGLLSVGKAADGGHQAVDQYQNKLSAGQREARDAAWRAAAEDDGVKLRGIIERAVSGEVDKSIVKCVHCDPTDSFNFNRQVTLFPLAMVCVSGKMMAMGPAIDDGNELSVDRIEGRALMVMMELGCDVNAACEPEATGGWTAVHQVCSRGNAPLLELMFKHARPKPDVSKKVPNSQETPLHLVEG